MAKSNKGGSKGQSNKAEAQTETLPIVAPQTETKPQTETIVPAELMEMDEAALLAALKAKREGKRNAVLVKMDEEKARFAVLMDAHRAAMAVLSAELRTLDAADGIKRASGGNGSGGSINVKGATAAAILSALKDGPMAVKDMKAVPSIAACMEGKYEKSFMAVALAALRTKGLVESAERGIWRLTAEGIKAASEVGTEAAAA